MLTTTHLTPGERLRIARRRTGNTQAQEATDIGMPLGAYKLAERDEAQPWNIPVPRVGKLSDFEACIVRRTRRGLTQTALANMIGVSKWWVCLMEQGKAPTDTLVGFWNN